MTGRQLRAFVAVAETLNFALAAERLHLSQPALSLAVKGLEESLGGRLLIRSTRRVRLTPEGEALLPRARRLLADWDDAAEMLREHFTLQRGHVTVAAMPSFAGNVLPDLLADFRERYPGVDVSVNDIIHEQVLEHVAAGRVEIGFAFEPDAAEHLRFEPLFLDRFVAVVPDSPAFPDEAPQSWAALLRSDFITLQRPSTVRHLLERTLQAHGINLSVAMECHQLATVGALVARGLGVSAVPALCAPQMRRLGTRCLPLQGPVVERAVGLIMRRGTELSTAAKAMHEVSKAMFQPREDALGRS